jgi:hypothetical protein
MKKQHHPEVVNNFLSSLDMDIKMIDHFRNCMRDAYLYDWSTSTVIEIMDGIEYAYRKKEN